MRAPAASGGRLDGRAACCLAARPFGISHDAHGDRHVQPNWEGNDALLVPLLDDALSALCCLQFQAEQPSISKGNGVIIVQAGCLVLVEFRGRSV